MAALTPNQILKILEITDSFNLHREVIVIPLTMKDIGSVDLLADGRLKITCPTGQPFDTWLYELRARLQEMDLSSVRSNQT